MPPTNRAVRQKPFINFLLLFTVTITIIVAVIFFSMEARFADTQYLQEEVWRLEDEKKFNVLVQNEFIEAVNLVKTLDTKEVQPISVNSAINSRLLRIDSLLKNVPDSQYVPYLTASYESLSSLKSVKNELRDLKAADRDANALRQRIEMLNSVIASKEQIIATYQSGMNRQ